MKNSLFKFLKLLLFFFLSLSFFYFFETPFLIETAGAEETLNEETSKMTVESSKDSGERSSNLPEKTKEVEPSLARKIGFFLGDYKGHFLMTGLVIISSVVIFGYFSAANPPVASAPVDPVALLQNPKLPDGKCFVEDSDLLKYSLETAKDLPEHFMAKKVCFANESGEYLTGIIFENSTSQLAYRVYPVKPTLLADPHHPVFDVFRDLKEQAIVPFNTAYSASIAVPEVVLSADTPFLYGNDPSMSFWVNHAKEMYPILNQLHPSLILQYQKVALVDPSAFTYAYFHQVSIVPTDIEALSTPYETNLQAKLIKVYLFKDNEAGGAS